MQIIRDRRVCESHWQHVPDGVLADNPDARLAGAIIVSLADWRLHKIELARRAVTIGVRLGAGDDIEEIADDLSAVALIALEFASFSEGRAYTQARLLRDRHGYQGEIRAVGDVSRDRLAFMERCGINAFEMGGNGNLEAALKAFAEISDFYQPAADRKPPIASYRS